MIRILILSIGLVGFQMKEMTPPPAEALCVLCTTHHGTCGCYLGHVVCCDGEDAYGCPCR